MKGRGSHGADGDRPRAARTTARPRRRRRKPEAPEKAGQLKPADPFDLIRLLARSQHDPRKAVAELVQNSLDAGARRILITRGRHRGVRMLSIRDDGAGVLPDLQRRQALSYIATNIGHSRKRDLSVQDRYQLFLQGKYGIGLLGFWCVGRLLQIRTKVGDEPALVLCLEEDSPRYEIRKDRRELELADVWTEVVVADLHETASRQLVGRRLSDYLAEELRGQLLQREVELRVVDQLARGRAPREFRVVPPRFKGLPLEQFRSVRVEGHRQPARLQLHYLPPETEERGRVGLFAGGTLVVEDLATVEGYDRPPWSSGRLVGLVDFAELDVAPGTRRGFVPNAASEALAWALTSVAQQLAQVLDRFEQERQRESDAALLKQLKRLFHDFGRRLPHYPLFDVETPTDVAVAGADAPAGRTDATDGDPNASGADSAHGAHGEVDGVAVDGPAARPDGLAVPVQSRLLLPGPLQSLEIVPREPLVEANQTRRLRAVARDASGQRIPPGGVVLFWAIGIGASLARLSPASGAEPAGDVVPPSSGSAPGPEPGPPVTAAEVLGAGSEGDGFRPPARGEVVADLHGHGVCFEAGGALGAVEVSVLAIATDGQRARASTTVDICDDLGGTRRAQLGIPVPHPVHAPHERWRSRMVHERWEYNSGHPDYLAVVEEPKRKLRYIASLLAKEVVLRGHPRPEIDGVLERMVEVLSWAERRMPRSG